MSQRPVLDLQEGPTGYLEPPGVQVVKEGKGVLALGTPRWARIAIGLVLVAVGGAVAFKAGEFSLRELPPPGWVIGGVLVALGAGIALCDSRVRVEEDPPAVAFERRFGPLVIRRRSWSQAELLGVVLSSVRRLDPAGARSGTRSWHWEFSGAVTMTDGSSEEFSHSSDLAHERLLCEKVAKRLRVPVTVRVAEDAVAFVGKAYSQIRMAGVIILVMAGVVTVALILEGC